uniref:Uncharacterized protein n=1 Tax=Solanum tuberosum TaxID=4113 RepID=M1BR30_SOLTU
MRHKYVAAEDFQTTKLGKQERYAHLETILDTLKFGQWWYQHLRKLNPMLKIQWKTVKV